MVSICIIGGTGTLGRALIRHILDDGYCERIVVFSRGEIEQWRLRMELSEDENARMRYMIGDIRDLDRLKMALSGVHNVIHAAAMKIVGTCAYNPFECVQTNVIGTENVIRACIHCGVRRALFVSSDKACAPASIYGASKLMGEELWKAASAYVGAFPYPVFGVARMGNLAGSRGSVIEAIRMGSTSISDPCVTRFWIKPADAAKWMMAVLDRMNQGEVIPYTGAPAVRLGDVFTAMGVGNPTVVGLAPGEKLHELMGDGTETSSEYAKKLSIDQITESLADRRSNK